MFIACLVTVIVEVIAFFIAGYGEDRKFIALVCAANVATTLTMNLILSRFYNIPLVIALEIAAVFIEYGVYSRYEGESKWLFYATALANVISFTIGLAL